MVNSPQYVAAARELRDRYIEQINAPYGLAFVSDVLMM
jgi:hypothetical protein